MSSTQIQSWHKVVQTRDQRALQGLLAEDVIFHSPVVHTPQRGKSVTALYLSAAFSVLGNRSFRYIREVCSGRNAILEFEVEIDGIIVNGVDMIHWNENDLIDEFKVMLRPLKAINLIHKKMGELLTK